MKKLLDRKTVNTQFGCDYCNKVLTYSKKMEHHESICYFNPNRDCGVFGCQNTGVSELGGDCEQCLIAKRCGGKSYIAIA